MILVVSPNPALDRVAAVRFEERSTLRPVRFSTWAGGSGVHAGYVATLLGASTTVLAFAGGHIGELFREHLDRQGLAHELIGIAAETRETFSLLDLERGNICDVAEPGPTVSVDEVRQFEKRALAAMLDAELLIVSGSLPAGCPIDLPARLISAARNAGIPAIADLAGDVLLASIQGRPWLVKPSRPEIAAILDTEPTIEATLALARSWLDAGVENICASLDADGLLWVSRGGIRHFTSPEEPAFNTIGSGDTLLGALAATWLRAHDLERALAVGVAAAAANLAYDAPGFCRPGDIDRLLPEITVRPAVNHSTPVAQTT